MRAVLCVLALSACTKEAPPESEAPVDEALPTALTGELTWEVTWPSSGEVCSYTRSYDAYEDVTVPWLCPGCEHTWRADVTILDGRDCLRRATGAPPVEQEWLAIGDGQIFRAANKRMSLLGDADIEDGVITVDAFNDYDTITATTLGSLTFAEADGDPMWGKVPPDEYACGWPKADPPPYTGGYETLTVGEVIPDFVLQDACGEWVRLHDLAGRYLLVDFSASDCGPCQGLAEYLDAEMAGLQAEGIDAMAVTLLAESLDADLATPSADLLQDWVDYFDLTSPVLADEGYGATMAYAVFGEDSVWPTLVAVDPELRVLWMGPGSEQSEGMQAIRDAAR